MCTISWPFWVFDKGFFKQQCHCSCNQVSDANEGHLLEIYPQRGSRADLLFILMWSLLLMSFVPLLQALVQELNFCAYLGLPAFMIPLRGPHCANLARVLLNHIHTGHHSCMVMAICSIEWKQICSEHTIICLCIHPGPIIYTQSSFLLLPFLFQEF